MSESALANAVMCWRHGRRTEAEQICRALIAQDSGAVDAYRLLADILVGTGRTAAALTICRRVAELVPTDAPIWLTIAGLFLSASRQEDALAAFHQAIFRAPSLARAHAGIGMTLIGLGRDAEGMEALARAVELDSIGATPVFLQAGYRLLQLGRPERALSAFSRLTQLQPASAQARQAHALTLVTLRRFEQAIPELDDLLQANANADYLRGVTFHARLQCCDWRNFDRDSAAITARVRETRRADAPLSFMVHNGSPGDQLLCARIYAADKCAAQTQTLCTPTPPANPSKIRVAYLSGDFREHAVGQSMVELLEAHDSSRFETFAFSTGPDDGSALRRRIEGGVNHFLQIAACSDQEIAARMVSLGIDIAVDLGGHSTGGRTGVLAFRAAAVQVSFLGFPGTTGTDYVDYLIADERAIPEMQRPHYSEQPVYLPDTCFPTPRRPDLSHPSRAQAGLPNDGFVYCAFHGPHKISPRMFAVWMQLLRAVPQSVLWLRGPSSTVRENLGQQAEMHGIARSRLIFAERTSTRLEHLARLSLADVLLDTYPYGAHSTASDALLACVPIVTLTGPAFASRVAFSLLHAAGLRALATESFEDYEALAIELGRRPARVAGLKSALATNPLPNDLFDPQRFCRRLEAAYGLMHARRLKGQRPSTMHIWAD